ncbi:MAG: chemotaxis protein, partial [Candidatus Methylomirabilales bacterium]
MSNKLQAVLDAMEIFQATFPEDACIVVADTEKVIGYLPGKHLDLKIQVGTSIDKFGGTVTE